MQEHFRGQPQQQSSSSLWAEQFHEAQGNQRPPLFGGQPGHWAEEYAQHGSSSIQGRPGQTPGNAWAEQFSSREVRGAAWAQEFNKVEVRIYVF